MINSFAEPKRNKKREKWKKKELVIFKRPNFIWLLAIALAIVLIVSTIPLIPQTRISITTDLDTIKNVSVETPNVPLIVSILPSPSFGKGAYTIEVEVSKNSEIVLNSTLQDIPSGEFTFVWIGNGRPKAGTYTITVYLLRATTQVDVFSLDVEF